MVQAVLNARNGNAVDHLFAHVDLLGKDWNRQFYSRAKAHDCKFLSYRCDAASRPMGRLARWSIGPLFTTALVRPVVKVTFDAGDRTK